MRRPNSSNRPSSLETQGREIVERLGGEWPRTGGMCRCPAHDARTPSLSMRLGERRLFFHCETGKVIRALGARGLLSPERAAGTGETIETPADPGRRNRGAAARLWVATRPIHGSPAESLDIPPDELAATVLRMGKPLPFRGVDELILKRSLVNGSQRLELAGFSTARLAFPCPSNSHFMTAGCPQWVESRH